MKRDAVSAVQESTCWREFLPRCLHDGDTLDTIVYGTAMEEGFDRRWLAGDGENAPRMMAWSDKWVYFSVFEPCTIDRAKGKDGLKVWRVARHPEVAMDDDE